MVETHENILKVNSVSRFLLRVVYGLSRVFTLRNERFKTAVEVAADVMKLER